MRFAIHILETFLEVATNNEVPIYLNMCISYSVLVIAQYWREDSTKVSGRVVLDLLSSLEDRYMNYPKMSLATRYVAGLAKRHVRAHMNISSATYASDVPPRNGHGSNPSNETPLYSAAEGLLGLGSFGAQSRLSLSVGLIDDLPDLGLTPSFPSMEDFFGGGFLDFIR